MELAEFIFFVETSETRKLMVVPRNLKEIHKVSVMLELLVW